MIILWLNIISIIWSTLAAVFHGIHLYVLYKYGETKAKKYRRFATFFRLLTLIFLISSTFLLYTKFVYDDKEHLNKFLTLVNVGVFLIPIAIIELFITMI